jgi:4-amino-4-deoxy-L-arabinose transferase-like glycosyltransferase
MGPQKSFAPGNLMDTESSFAPILTLKSRHLGLILLFLLGTTLLFSNLWIGDLGLDSCAYATISRAMLRTHDWLVPHYEHSQEYADCWLHPPLFYWLTALSFRAFGVNEFAARFAVALLGLGTILLVYAIGRRLGGSAEIGFFSGFVLLTTQPFLELSRKCQIDVPLAFFISLAVYFFILGRTGEKRRVFDALAGAATGLALLLKGIPAASVLGLVVLYALVSRDWRFFRPGRLGLFLLAMALVLGLWLVPLAQAGEMRNFLKGYFVDQVWANFSGSAQIGNVGLGGRIASYFWYIGVLAKRYWPWLPFLLFSSIMALKIWKKNKWPVLFLLWILIVLVGFSAGGTKFYRYLAPVYPGAALLIGATLGDRVSPKVYRGFLYASSAMLIVILFATSVAPLYFGRIQAPDKTDIKRMAPYIRDWTAAEIPIATYKIGHWGAVADFAFYVDRPIRSFNTEDGFAAYLRQDKSFGYLQASEYASLQEGFRNEFVPVIKSRSFYLITNRAEFERLIQKIFPIPLY